MLCSNGEDKKRFQTGSTGGLSGIMSRMLNRKTSGIMSRMLDRKTSKAGRTNFHNQELTEKETNDISKKDEGGGSWIC